MSQIEFALYLMDCWHEGKTGDWARDLAIKIQDSLYEEFL